MANLAFPVNNNYDYCPICKGNPKECPHSLYDMAERLWANWVRMLIRGELKSQGLI